MFHLVHSPRFPLLAPLKLTFSKGTSNQMFGYSSLTMDTDSVLFCSGHRCTTRHAPTICPPLNSDVSPIVFNGLENCFSFIVQSLEFQP